MRAIFPRALQQPTKRQLATLSRLVDPHGAKGFDDGSSYLMLHTGDALCTLIDGDLVLYRIVDRRGSWSGATAGDVERAFF